MNLYEKIAEVMKDIQYLSKDGNIEYKTTKYKAISEEKVTTAVRKSLIEHKLIIYPAKQDHKKEGALSTVDVIYRIVNIENPEEYIEVASSGTGADTQDKGVGKAMTYAYKYMLLRTFAIPTGEDPDKIASSKLDDDMKAEEERRAEEERLKLLERERISELDVKALKSRFEQEGIDIQKICSLYKVAAIDELTNKQHANINEHFDKIKDACVIDKGA